jgi:hypothetical protein
VMFEALTLSSSAITTIKLTIDPSSTSFRFLYTVSDWTVAENWLILILHITLCFNHIQLILDLHWDIVVKVLVYRLVHLSHYFNSTFIYTFNDLFESLVVSLGQFKQFVFALSDLFKFNTEY